MRKGGFGIGVAVLAVAAAYLIRGQSAGGDGFGPSEWAAIHTLSPLPDLPVDTTNKYRDSDAAALLGQKLFFEPRFSGPIQTGTPAEGQLGAIGQAGKIACRASICFAERFLRAPKNGLLVVTSLPTFNFLANEMFLSIV
jgi:hypothetical protein